MPELYAGSEADMAAIMALCAPSSIRGDLSEPAWARNLHLFLGPPSELKASWRPAEETLPAKVGLSQARAMSDSLEYSSSMHESTHPFNDGSGNEVALVIHHSFIPSTGGVGWSLSGCELVWADERCDAGPVELVGDGAVRVW